MGGGDREGEGEGVGRGGGRGSGAGRGRGERVLLNKVTLPSLPLLQTATSTS